MRPLSSIIYRYLTNADFFNMYKPRGSEARGGGQTYVDFPTQDVPLAQWEAFFAGVPGVIREERTQGAAWTVPINNVGLTGGRQMVLIYRRRPQSVSVARQTLDRPQTNRVEAWHPRRGFPEPADPSDRQQCPAGLAVFFARSVDNTLWAGWFLNADGTRLPAHAAVRGELGRLLTVPTNNRHRAGIINLAPTTVWLDENDISRPFRPPPRRGSSRRRATPRRSIQVSLPIERRPRVQERLQRQRTRATDARGYQLDPKRRSAVEKYAMERAKAAYPGAEDTSQTESFDLRTREGGKEVRVEVKGTLGRGACVLLTASEVANAFGSVWRTDLFVVSNIQLTQDRDKFVASGGRTRVIRGWVPGGDDLRPTQYRYRVPE